MLQLQVHGLAMSFEDLDYPIFIDIQTLLP